MTDRPLSEDQGCNCDEHDMYCPHMNTDLLSGLTPEEVCERPEAGTCDKCGARWDQGCQLGPEMVVEDFDPYAAAGESPFSLPGGGASL